MNLEWWIAPWRSEANVWLVVSAFFVALACALPGVFLILRRMALAGDAISHSVLPGIVVAFLFTAQYGDESGDAGNGGKHVRSYFKSYEPDTFMCIDDWASVGGRGCAGARAARAPVHSVVEKRSTVGKATRRVRAAKRTGGGVERRITYRAASSSSMIRATRARAGSPPARRSRFVSRASRVTGGWGSLSIDASTLTGLTFTDEAGQYEGDFFSNPNYVNNLRMFVDAGGSLYASDMLNECSWP